MFYNIEKYKSYVKRQYQSIKENVLESKNYQIRMHVQDNEINLENIPMNYIVEQVRSVNQIR